jgi:hypothetical protein
MNLVDFLSFQKADDVLGRESFLFCTDGELGERA